MKATVVNVAWALLATLTCLGVAWIVLQALVPEGGWRK